VSGFKLLELDRIFQRPFLWLGAISLEQKILVVEQVAPYAPLEMKRADLDREPVASILQRLKTTGKLILDGDTLTKQQCLFE